MEGVFNPHPSLICPAGANPPDTPFFGAYDFGRRGNEAAYNQAKPPPYNLSAYKIPTALFMGTHDDLVAPSDAARLIAALPKAAVVAKRTFTDFSHLTWFAGES